MGRRLVQRLSHSDVGDVAGHRRIIEQSAAMVGQTMDVTRLSARLHSPIRPPRNDAPSRSCCSSSTQPRQGPSGRRARTRAATDPGDITCCGGHGRSSPDHDSTAHHLGARASPTDEECRGSRAGLPRAACRMCREGNGARSQFRRYPATRTGAPCRPPAPSDPCRKRKQLRKANGWVRS